MAITPDQYRSMRQKGMSKDQIFAQEHSFQDAPAPAPNARPPGASPITAKVADFGTGFGKGAINTTVKSTGLVQRGLDFIADKFTGTKARPRVDQIVPEKAFTPSNTAQKAGFATEQIAEFFLPGGLTKGVRQTLKLSTAPDVVKILARAALGAGESAVVTAAQGGTTEQTGKAARLGATFDAVGGTWSKLLKTKTAQGVMTWLTEQIPSRMVNSILRPPEKAFAFGRNPGLGVVEEGITANSRGDLLTKIAERKREIGESIDAALNSDGVAGKILDITTALKPIDDAITQATKRGERQLVRQLIDLRDGLTKDYDLVAGELVERGPKPMQLIPKEVQQLKIDVGQSTRWTGQPFDSDLNKVRVSVYRNLDKLVDNAVNGMDVLNGRYANLLTAEKALEKANNQLQKLVMVGLKMSGFGGLAAGSSYLSGDSGLEALFKGAVAAGVTKAAGSTPVKTRAAGILNRLAPTDREALFDIAPALRNVILGVRQKGNAASDDKNGDE